MRRLFLALTTCAALLACTSDDEDGSIPPPEPDRVGFEIMQVVSPDETITWLNGEMSQAEFDAIELPTGWFKNQPREPDVDGGTFFRSPDGAQDGDFTFAEHFGHRWMHAATITEMDVPLDAEGLIETARTAATLLVSVVSGPVGRLSVGNRLPALVTRRLTAGTSRGARLLPRGGGGTAATGHRRRRPAARGRLVAVAAAAARRTRHSGDL